jgi:hypothetical protein
VKDDRKVDVVKALLLEEGLGYGKLPKALLKFHHYERFDRLALEEHLVEAARYATDNGGVARLHFTVSPEHEQPFKDAASKLINQYQQKNYSYIQMVYILKNIPIVMVEMQIDYFKKVW